MVFDEVGTTFKQLLFTFPELLNDECCMYYLNNLAELDRLRAWHLSHSALPRDLNGLQWFDVLHHVRVQVMTPQGRGVPAPTISGAPQQYQPPVGRGIPGPTPMPMGRAGPPPGRSAIDFTVSASVTCSGSQAV